MRVLYILAPVLHWFVGIGATAGGIGAILNPTSPMGMSTEALKTGPFKDFLLPGLFLAVVLGLFNSITGFFVINRTKYHEAISGSMGVVLMVWIVVQCVILSSVHALHILFFAIGALQGILALVMMVKNDAFPYNIVARALSLKK